MINTPTLNLWFAQTEKLSFPEIWETHSPLLPQRDKEKILAYRFDKDRILSLVSRVMVRRMLSSLVPDKAPESWHFSTKRFGKPFIEGTGDETQLQFNLSHTNGLVACAVAPDIPIGIDVEVISDKLSTLEMAPTVFTASELADLQALAGRQEQFRYFYRLWTLKEAYLKCVGDGLSMPLQGFEFSLREAKIKFKTTSENREQHPITFCSTRFNAEHMLSIAVQTENRFDIEARDFSDLQHPLPTDIFFDFPFR